MDTARFISWVATQLLEILEEVIHLPGNENIHLSTRIRHLILAIREFEKNQSEEMLNE